MKELSMPPADEIESLYFWDRLYGCLRWIADRNYKARAGSVAGSTDRDGYRQIRIGGRLYKEHRVIYFLATGDDPGALRIDHIDGRPSNNCIHNLRPAKQHENGSHRHGPKSGSKSGVRGVYWSSSLGMWRTCATRLGKRHSFGSYQTITEAERAVIAGRETVFGEFCGTEKMT